MPGVEEIDRRRREFATRVGGEHAPIGERLQRLAVDGRQGSVVAVDVIPHRVIEQLRARIEPHAVVSDSLREARAKAPDAG